MKALPSAPPRVYLFGIGSLALLVLGFGLYMKAMSRLRKYIFLSVLENRFWNGGILVWSGGTKPRHRSRDQADPRSPVYITVSQSLLKADW